MTLSHNKIALITLFYKVKLLTLNDVIRLEIPASKHNIVNKERALSGRTITKQFEQVGFQHNHDTKHFNKRELSITENFYGIRKNQNQ